MLQLTRVAGVLLLGALTVTTVQAGAWTRVNASEFTVLTDGRADDVREWVMSVEALRRDVQSTILTDARFLDPVVVIATSDTNALREAVGPSTGVGNPFMLFNQRRGHFVGLLQVAEPAARRALLLQATDWSLAGVHLPPRWLRVGLSEVYATMKRQGDRLIVGGAIPEGGAISRRALPIPIEKLVTVTAVEAKQFNDFETAAFTAESCALAYALWFGDEGATRGKIGRYAELLNRGESAATAFAEAFSEGTATLEAKVTVLAKKGTLPSVALTHRVAELAQVVTLTPASETEVQRGFVLVYAGTPASGRAATALARLQQLEPEAVTTREMEAEFLFATNEQAKALAVMREAAEAGSKNYAMYLVPAMMTSSQMFFAEFATDRPDSKLARESLDGLKRAIALRPEPESYEIFALLIGAAEKVNDDDARVLSEARLRWPHSGLFVAGQMAYALRKGDLAQAGAAFKLLQEGRVSVTEKTALFAGKLQRRLTALTTLAQLDASVAAHDLAKATELAGELNGAPLTAAERQRVDAASAGNASGETLEQVRTAIAEKDWLGAEIFLDELKSNGVPDSLREEVEKLEAEIAAGKKR